MGKGSSKGMKGSRKGKGRGKGKKPRTPFAELSEEKKEAIRARHEEVQAEQGRETVDDDVHPGKLLQRGKKYGWIKPLAFNKLPSEVQAKIKKMNQQKRRLSKRTIAQMKYSTTTCFSSI